jgi:hypothetical protein
MVRNAKHVTIMDSDGNKYVDGLVRNWNMSMDVALVRFSTTRASIRATAQSPYAPYARLDTDSNWERAGEKVYVFGNPGVLNGLLPMDCCQLAGRMARSFKSLRHRVMAAQVVQSSMSMV